MRWARSSRALFAATALLVSSFVGGSLGDQSLRHPGPLVALGVMLASFTALWWLTAAAPKAPGPDMYAVELREAIEEAEAGDDGTPERHFYAIGLRVAAGLYGLPEGTDPASRPRAGE